MSFFYEIRSPDNTVLKRDGGLLRRMQRRWQRVKTPKKRKNSRQPAACRRGRDRMSDASWWDRIRSYAGLSDAGNQEWSMLPGSVGLTVVWKSAQ